MTHGRFRFNTLIPVLVLLSVTAFADGDAAAGKAKSVTCAGCHGANGVSTNPMWPSLAGQKAYYLAKQLRDFRDGKRHNPVMAPMAKGLSDQDIENLAAYYSSLDP
jgi:cytochrome c553